jgi:MFS family permease
LNAFRHRDYRLLWGSQLFSLTGTWMQSLAQSWLVLAMTNSPLQLGLINVCQFGPSLVLGLPGGVLADRFPKRRLLLASQTVYALLTALLAVLVASGRIELWHIYAVALGLGCVNAVDMPTRQAFVTDIVGKEDVGNAVALNSALFNGSRVVGPALAGILLSTAGAAVCFVINAASYLPVLAALLLMRTDGRATGVVAGERALERLRQGLAYVAGTPTVLRPIVLVGLVATFGMNFNVWVPLLARDDLAIGAGGFGLLMSALGVGSLTGALALAFSGRRPGRRLMLATCAAFGLTEAALAVAARVGSPLPVVLLLMAVVGFSMSTTMAMANTVVQTTAPDELRGRVMSIYMTVFAGSTPLGAALAGGAAAAFGTPPAVAAGGLVVLLSALGVGAWDARATPRLPLATEPGAAPSASPAGGRR